MRELLTDPRLRPLHVFCGLLLLCGAPLISQIFGLSVLRSERDAKADALEQMGTGATRAAGARNGGDGDLVAVSAGSASAALDSRLRDLLRDHAASPVETETIGGNPDGAGGDPVARLVGLRAVFDASNVSLQAILYELETSRSGVAIQELRVERAQRELATEDPPLRASVTLSAPWRRSR